MATVEWNNHWRRMKHRSSIHHNRMTSHVIYDLTPPPIRSPHISIDSWKKYWMNNITRFIPLCVCLPFVYQKWSIRVAFHNFGRSLFRFQSVYRKANGRFWRCWMLFDVIGFGLLIRVGCRGDLSDTVDHSIISNSGVSDCLSTRSKMLHRRCAAAGYRRFQRSVISSTAVPSSFLCFQMSLFTIYYWKRIFFLSGSG